MCAGGNRHERRHYNPRRWRIEQIEAYSQANGFPQTKGGIMRALVCVLVFMSMCAVYAAQRATQPATLAQMTSQSGQQLFPNVGPDKSIVYSQRNGADWDVYVLQHASPPINLTAN